MFQSQHKVLHNSLTNRLQDYDNPAVRSLPTTCSSVSSTCPWKCTTYNHQWYTDLMPTTLPRIQVTVTPELAEALEQARRRWPTLSASQLVASLATTGADALDKPANRHDVLEETAGTLRGVYPDNYLAELREDWS